MTKEKAVKVVKEKVVKEKAESTAFERKWPVGIVATKAQIAAFIKSFPKTDAVPTRMQVIRKAIEVENNFDADSIVIVMESIFSNSDWGKIEADSARRREFRNIENPKERKPRGRPAKEKVEGEEKPVKEKTLKRKVVKEKAVEETAAE